MVKFYVYILHSIDLDKFYIGATRLNVESRLERHIEEYYGKSKFTSKASDWKIFLVIECENYKIALKIENHIKKMKSKSYIKNLKKYPEIIDKLRIKYSAS